MPLHKGRCTAARLLPTDGGNRRHEAGRAFKDQPDWPDWRHAGVMKTRSIAEAKAQFEALLEGPTAL